MYMKILRSVFFLLTAMMTASAQAQDMKMDAKQPIEITADSLEVSQKEQQATFTGNVVAVQGAMKITSDRMKVFYRTGQQTKGNAQAISRIEVQGNVFMTNTSETARSKSGVYDVDANKLHLKNEVVLTRGENVVKGEALEYDLTTGKSQIVGAGVTTGGSADNAGGGSGGRVRGLFVPGSSE
jgi:lipopolysaccharide export system protein LptA